MLSTDENRAQDQADIRALIERHGKAICARNVDQIMQAYAPDYVGYDVKPPTQIKGAAAFRKTWEACLPCFPDGFDVERRDLVITAGQEVAAAHWLQRFIQLPANHPAGQMWLRITAVMTRAQGQWRITHEHVSTPFDPMTGKAVFAMQV